jgi:hypothetical protein
MTPCGTKSLKRDISISFYPPPSVAMKVRSLIHDFIIATTGSGDRNANRYPEVQPAMASSNVAFGVKTGSGLPFDHVA